MVTLLSSTSSNLFVGAIETTDTSFLARDNTGDSGKVGRYMEGKIDEEEEDARMMSRLELLAGAVEEEN